jgi:hypothetical protein
MKAKYPDKEYLGIAGLAEFVKASVQLAYGSAVDVSRVHTD